jgi:hypothetical protein
VRESDGGSRGLINRLGPPAGPRPGRRHVERRDKPRFPPSLSPPIRKSTSTATGPSGRRLADGFPFPFLMGLRGGGPGVACIGPGSPAHAVAAQPWAGRSPTQRAGLSRLSHNIAVRRCWMTPGRPINRRKGGIGEGEDRAMVEDQSGICGPAPEMQCPSQSMVENCAHCSVDHGPHDADALWSWAHPL